MLAVGLQAVVVLDKSTDFSVIVVDSEVGISEQELVVQIVNSELLENILDIYQY